MIGVATITQRLLDMSGVCEGHEALQCCGLRWMQEGIHQDLPNYPNTKVDQMSNAKNLDFEIAATESGILEAYSARKDERK